MVKCSDDQLPYELGRASAAIDAWAFGVLIFLAVSRRPLVPVAVDTDGNLHSGDSVRKATTWTDKELELRKDEYMESSSEDAIDLLKRLLKVNVAERPSSMTDILGHAFSQVDNAAAASLVVEEVRKRGRKVEADKTEWPENAKRTKDSPEPAQRFERQGKICCGEYWTSLTSRTASLSCRRRESALRRRLRSGCRSAANILTILPF